MKKIYRRLLILLTLTTAIGFISSTYAKVLTQYIQVHYCSIKVYLDGELISLKDGDGKEVEPFIHEGTTYVPLRAVSNAFGKNVSWDGSTNTIYLGEHAQDIVEVKVKTPEEFIKALGSNRKIIMEPGYYNLSRVSEPSSLNPKIQIKNIFDGYELVLGDICNLTIEGSSEEKTEIVIEPRYAFVFNFVNGDKINIHNITMGHTDEGYCVGGVLKFKSSKNILLENTHLYGCGTVGISLDNVNTLTMNKSSIYDCTYNLMDIYNSTDVSFTNSEFKDSGMFNQIQINNSDTVLFDHCMITNNTAFYDAGSYTSASYLFSDVSSYNVSVTNSTIKGNTYKRITPENSRIRLSDNTIENNHIFQELETESIYEQPVFLNLKPYTEDKFSAIKLEVSLSYYEQQNYTVLNSIRNSKNKIKELISSYFQNKTIYEVGSTDGKSIAKTDLKNQINQLLQGNTDTETEYIHEVIFPTWLYQ